MTEALGLVSGNINLSFLENAEILESYLEKVNYVDETQQKYEEMISHYQNKFNQACDAILLLENEISSLRQKLESHEPENTYKSNQRVKDDLTPSTDEGKDGREELDNENELNWENSMYSMFEKHLEEVQLAAKSKDEQQTLQITHLEKRLESMTSENKELVERLTKSETDQAVQAKKMQDVLEEKALINESLKQREQEGVLLLENNKILQVELENNHRGLNCLRQQSESYRSNEKALQEQVVSLLIAKWQLEEENTELFHKYSEQQEETEASTRLRRASQNIKQKLREAEISQDSHPIASQETRGYRTKRSTRTVNTFNMLSKPPSKGSLQLDTNEIPPSSNFLCSMTEFNKNLAVKPEDHGLIQVTEQEGEGQASREPSICDNERIPLEGSVIHSLTALAEAHSPLTRKESLIAIKLFQISPENKLLSTNKDSSCQIYNKDVLGPCSPKNIPSTKSNMPLKRKDYCLSCRIF